MLISTAHLLAEREKAFKHLSQEAGYLCPPHQLELNHRFNSQLLANVRSERPREGCVTAATHTGYLAQDFILDSQLRRVKQWMKVLCVPASPIKTNK